MKTYRFTTLSSAAALAVGLAATPASADVFVFAEIDKDKDVTVDITITKEKFVTIDTDFDRDLTSAAEAFAINNQVNERNFVGRSDNAPEGQDGFFNFLLNLSATMDGSVSDNQGIVGINQDAGNVNNQANVVATAIIQQDVDAADAAPSFAHSEASTEQRNNNNEEEHLSTLTRIDPDGDLTPDNLVRDKTAAIRDSVNNNSGIVGVNQATGNGLNQSNNIAVSVGIGSVLALSEADLGQENSNNTLEDVNTVKLDVIRGSVNGNQGIIAGNQSVGAFNNQANAISFSALRTAATIGVPGT
jgi:hypothetical protein